MELLDSNVQGSFDGFEPTQVLKIIHTRNTFPKQPNRSSKEQRIVSNTPESTQNAPQPILQNHKFLNHNHLRSRTELWTDEN